MIFSRGQDKYKEAYKKYDELKKKNKDKKKKNQDKKENDGDNEANQILEAKDKNFYKGFHRRDIKKFLNDYA